MPDTEWVVAPFHPFIARVLKGVIFAGVRVDMSPSLFKILFSSISDLQFEFIFYTAASFDCPVA